MKITIQQKVLLDALEKGSIAALSEDAQSDTSTLSLLIKSVKLSADKHFTVESNTDLLAVKNSVLANEESGINVKEPGTIVVPAKELMDWVKNQGSEAVIGIVLQKFQTPEAIHTLGEMENEDVDTSKFIIRKIGTVKISSRNTSLGKTAGKWELDCYDSDQKPSVNFSEKSDKNFEINGKQLGESLTNVGFAALDKDHEHVLDSISIQICDQELYFAATDMQHCALYKIPKDTVSDIQSSKSILVPAVIMEQAVKVINPDEKVIFSYSEEKERVYLSQTNLRIRMACTEKQHINKFPSIEVLLKKQYKLLAECPKNVMNAMLIDASLVNKSSALFVFTKENGTLMVKAVSEDNKYKPNIKQSEVNSISKDSKIILGVDHLIKGLKVINTDDVQLYFPDNMKSIKIMGKGNENLIYFTMAMENPRYNLDE
jgi:DNA polymerase III sliding clamp (beta) subunit (PCNA family)